MYYVYVHWWTESAQINVAVASGRARKARDGLAIGDDEK